MQARSWLSFLSPLYLAGQKIDRLLTHKKTLPAPLISVGNIASGGRAKTPMIIALARRLQERGYHPVVLTRGYGRKSSEPMWLTSLWTADESLKAAMPQLVLFDKKFLADECGDEALEIFAQSGATVLIGAKRFENGLQFLKAVNATSELSHGKIAQKKWVFLLDDGFQHWALARDLDIVLLDEKDYGDRVLPAGFLRESPRALKRADLVLTRGRDFEKKSVFPEIIEQPDSLLSVTSRAPDPRYSQLLQEKFPGLKELKLRDHASREEILSQLKSDPEKSLLLGAKEAAKLFSFEEYRKFLSEGRATLDVDQAHQQQHHRCYYVGCELEIFRAQEFWAAVERLL